MGPFPHDEAAEPLRPRSRNDLLSLGGDEDRDPLERDQAMWEMVYSADSEAQDDDLVDLLYTVATSAKEPVLRRSASWGLFKLGAVRQLADSLEKDDDGNVHSWKQHLIYEAQGRTDWADPRPIRSVESELGFAITLPLTIHGVVQFRTFDYRRDWSEAEEESPSSPQYARGYSARVAPRAERPDYRSMSPEVSPPSYGAPDQRASQWHAFPAGPIAQRRLVGDLTASVGLDTFYDNLIIQKVVNNPLGRGWDHVQGYLFQGMSRSLGGNVMAHYYTSRGPQPLYLSGRIGDASAGVIFVDTQLVRTAETNIAIKDGVEYPFVQSVRGLFFGPARMNTIVARDPEARLDNLLQIVKEPYANGYFFGEFRSVPVDVDGDDTVELNGMEMYTDLDGNVTNRTPEGPQASLKFAR